MADTKVRIQSTALLTALRKHRAQMEADYKKATEKHEQERERWVAAARKAIEDALGKDISKMRVSGYGSNVHIEVPVRADRPAVPTRPNFDRLDREIKLLEIAEDQVVTINSDDSRAHWL